MKKKIIIGILIAALVAGGSAGGAVYYKKSHQKTVSVVSVDSLAGQYYICLLYTSPSPRDTR